MNMKMKGVAVGLLVLSLLALGTVGPGPALAAEEEQPTPPKGTVLIPAGSFWMGDGFGEGSPVEFPVREVYVSGFYMDVYEVTKALWDEVAVWAQENGYDIGSSDGSGKGPAHPVTEISWYEAVKWANARSEKEGLVPVYYTDGTLSTVYRTGRLDVKTESVDWTARGYRLPTEAEWERAARGELVGARYPWGNNIDPTRANYGSHVGSPAEVGAYAPSGYGLYDIVGNVYEWCWDRYASLPSGVADPRGPGSGDRRVSRGGSWASSPEGCRVANRLDLEPTYESQRLGFRLVISAP